MFSVTHISHGILSDDDIEVQESALYAVAQINESPDGVQAVRGFKVWEYFPEYLDSSNSQTHQFRCRILVRLAVYEIEALGSPPEGSR